jgi:hypothetical protein
VTPCAATGPCVPGTLGPLDSCIAPAVGANFDVDIIVNAIPSTGTAGIGLDLLFNPAVVTVVSKANDNTHSVLSAGPNSNVQDFSVTVANANSSGDYRIDLLDLDQNQFESGAGPLVRITLHPVAIGNTALTLDDTVGGDGTPDVFDPSANAYNITHIVNAQVHVGGTCP